MSTAAGPILIALGSNLGDRAANLRASLRLMREAGIVPERVSSVWESEPVPAGQPSYLNAVAEVEAALPPLELLAALKAIENALGRRPAPRWGPRPIDLDILFYGNAELSTPAITIPHPLVAERAFVLAPLSEVCPGSLPVLGRTALELLAEASPLGVWRAPVNLEG